MSAYTESPMEQAIERIYDAALDASRWSTAIKAIGSAIDGGADLLIFDMERNRADFVELQGFDPAFLDDYYRHYLSLNPYIKPYGDAPCGQVLWGEDLVAWDELRMSEFYNDFMCKAGLSRGFPGVKLIEDERRHASIAINPPQSRIENDALRIARELLCLGRHVKQAIEVNRLTERASLAARTVEDTVEAVAAAAFVIDQEHCVLHANRKAEALLRESKLMLRASGGSLRCWRPDEDSRLALFLNADAGACDRPIRLRSLGSDASYVAWKIPIQRFQSRGSSSRQAIRVVWPEAATLLIVAPIDIAQRIPEEIISSAFDLTPAEARIVSALVSGQTPKAYAETAGLSIRTVRHQLTTVFNKTGTTRQSELLALVICTLALCPSRG